MDASCWVARKIFLSAARASSSARTLDSRPTTKGVIMKGKMTTSRMGIIGSFLLSNFSLDVVTDSPWDYRSRAALHLPQFYPVQANPRHGRTNYSLQRIRQGPPALINSCCFGDGYPAFSIMAKEALRFSTISR